MPLNEYERKLYPEHAKQEDANAAVAKNEAISEFLDYLRDTLGVTLCKLVTFKNTRALTNKEQWAYKERGEEPPEFVEYDLDPEFAPAGISPHKLIAGFLGLDLAKLDDEKRAMLDRLREETSRASR